MKVVLTGTSGFVGSNLLAELVNKGHRVSSLGRKFIDVLPQGVSQEIVEDFSNVSELKSLSESPDVFIHCAARAHVMDDQASDPLEEFRWANTSATMNLAKLAMNAGVKRFIFISTIKVNGESTTGREPFSAKDKPNPQDPYAISKYEAEQGLKELAVSCGMEVVIIRPPLVYGSGVKGNFRSLLNLVNKGYPLPFGGLTKNKRSLVFVGNLVSLILETVENHNAGNKTFLVSDDHDVSTAGLISGIQRALGKKGLLLPLPPWLFLTLGKLANKQPKVDRLVGDLQLDIQHTRNALGWKPPYTVSEGLKLSVQSS